MCANSIVPEIYPIVVPMSSSLRSVNFYLVKNQNSLFLIDAGLDTEKCWNHFIDVLDENGFKIEDINKIILTHSHPDHTGLVNRILTIHEIPVFVNYDAIARLTRDPVYLNKRIDFFQSLYAEMGCEKRGEKQVEKLKKAVKKNDSQAIYGEIIPVAEGDIIEGFRVIDTPGHAPDHISFLHPDSGIFIGGDHLIQHVSSNALIEPDKHGELIPSLQQYEQSLLKCLNLSLSVVYPGHGEIVRAPDELIKKRLAGLESKSEKIKNIIADIPYSAAQIAQIFYEEKYDSEFSLVMSEIIGHLERLEALGEIARKKKGNLFYYYAYETAAAGKNNS